jgi:hypothetical protein
MEIVKEGVIFKGTSSSDVVVDRFVVLSREGTFFTYQDKANEPENSKAWMLDSKCYLTPAEDTEITKAEEKVVRPKGTWTITTAWGKSGKKVNLVRYSHTSPSLPDRRRSTCHHVVLHYT